MDSNSNNSTTLPASSLQPKSILDFTPSEEDIYLKTSKSKIRIMFDGAVSTQFTPDETSLIASFREHAASQEAAQNKDEKEQKNNKSKGSEEKQETNKVNLCPLSEDPVWTNAYILRFLVANGGDLQKTLACVQEHRKWRIEWLPPKTGTNTLSYLSQGLCYCPGVDSHFRPILVIKVGIINSLKLNIQDMQTLLAFFIEELSKAWLVEGKVENWVLLADMQGLNVATVPYGVN